jgi:hypothetical protein
MNLTFKKHNDTEKKNELTISEAHGGSLTAYVT